ncbi:agmatine deiminase family protein [Solihabitans fulvus]|uniref:agmatine deiminase family protein n=1 Tax=Solihabitans fulvus TaxID=1892852 RepID=UPI001CB75CB0|nr:agmatine deiminase family protein [Solihabitans fulvus]
MGGALLAGCDGRTPTDATSTGGSSRAGGSPDARTWSMPDEGEPHQRTWMAFGVSDRIWEPAQVPVIRQNLAAIATAVARFEPVSMLVRPEELDVARGLVAGANVELIAAPIDDLWMRDTGPVFVKGAGGRAGVDFNFNGWGGKQDHASDAKVAQFVSGRAGVQTVRAGLVLEGGGIEVDGEGTAIITESCVLNGNRNPGLSKRDAETALADLLGLKKVIWLPGIAGRDITDGHTDFYARFARPGVVVAGLDTDPKSYDHDVTERHLAILKAATDARGRPLHVEVIAGPTRGRSEFAGKDFAAGYINFYVCNGAVIAPEFGDPEADAAARATLERLFPGRQVVQINIDGIASGGGGIHCTTQQEPT